MVGEVGLEISRRWGSGCELGMCSRAFGRRGSVRSDDVCPGSSTGVKVIRLSYGVLESRVPACGMNNATACKIECGGSPDIRGGTKDSAAIGGWKIDAQS